MAYPSAKAPKQRPRIPIKVSTVRSIQIPSFPMDWRVHTDPSLESKGPTAYRFRQNFEASIS